MYIPNKSVLFNQSVLSADQTRPSCQ